MSPKGRRFVFMPNSRIMLRAWWLKEKVCAAPKNKRCAKRTCGLGRLEGGFGFSNLSQSGIPTRELAADWLRGITAWSSIRTSRAASMRQRDGVASFQGTRNTSRALCDFSSCTSKQAGTIRNDVSESLAAWNALRHDSEDNRSVSDLGR
jgi:hypothetical protein